MRNKAEVEKWKHLMSVTSERLFMGKFGQPEFEPCLSGKCRGHKWTPVTTWRVEEGTEES